MSDTAETSLPKVVQLTFTQNELTMLLAAMVVTDGMRSTQPGSEIIVLSMLRLLQHLPGADAVSTSVRHRLTHAQQVLLETKSEPRTDS